MYFFTSVENIGDEILFRGYKDGKAFKERVEFTPTLYIPTTEPSSFKSIYGNTVKPIQPGNIKQCRQFIKEYSGVSNFSFYGMTNWIYSFLAEEFPGEIEYDFNQLKIAYIDIEVDSEGGYATVEGAEKEITAITLFLRDKYMVFGIKDYAPEASNVKYIQCLTENDLILKFLSVWEKLEFDAITGWNIEGFDLPYIINRIRRVLGPKVANRLSPWGKIRAKIIPGMRGMDIPSYDIYGMIVLDYLPLFRKFSYITVENYKLNTVAHTVVGEKKIDFSEYTGLNELYKKDFKKFIDYNIRDVGLIVKMEKKLNLLQLIFNLAYLSKINVIDCFKQTRIWDAVIHHWLLAKNIVIPKKDISDDEDKIEGGYNKETRPGMYDWVISLDLTSLYPSLIMWGNIGPETLRNKVDLVIDDLIHHRKHGYEELLLKNNWSLTANGCMFDKSQKSFIADITGEYFDRRQKFKKMMLKADEEYQQLSKEEKETDRGRKLSENISIYNIYQQNYKISLNALYGSLSNPGFRFYDKNLGEAITISGQLTVQRAILKLNEYLNKILKTENKDYVLAADTDSVYLHLEEVVKKSGLKDRAKIIDFLDKFCKEYLQPKLDTWFNEMKEYMNSYEQKLFMKREKICERALWTAKKRYITLVWDNEGVRFPEAQLKVTGIEAVRSNTPDFCKKKLKQAFKIIMTQTEIDLHNFITKTEAEFNQLPPDEMAIPTGVRGLIEYADPVTIYKKGTPMHTRASLVYNKRVKDLGLENKFELILEGDKIKYIFLKQPNYTHGDVISFMQFLPDELKLTPFIDKKRQWEKTFATPLTAVVRPIGWNLEKQDTLADAWE